MLMLIIGMSLLYLLRDELPAHQPVGGRVDRGAAAVALAAAGGDPGCWSIVLGFFLPPVSIILMTAPIILPPLKAAGFDLVWFGVVMTIVMEMGLIHPPVGLNIFVIKNIAPDIPLGDDHLGRAALRAADDAGGGADLPRAAASPCGCRTR